MTAGIGHNGGPEMTGVSWRTHCWKAARERLLPTLPIEVVRMRVRRAAELGLDYKTYAGIRASTGHDLVAFLFSSNALRVYSASAQVSLDKRAKVAGIQAGTIGLATAPLRAEDLARMVPELRQSHPSPLHLASFADARSIMRAALGTLPADAVLLVGDHRLEAEWCMAGRLAGYLPSDRFFGVAGQENA